MHPQRQILTIENPGMDASRLEALLRQAGCNLVSVQAEDAGLTAGACSWPDPLDAMSEPICLLDTLDRIQRCNRAFATLMGKTVEQIRDRPGNEILQASRETGTELPFASARTTRQAQRREHRLDGRAFTVTITPLVDSHGMICGTVLSMNDITERKEMEASLRQSNRSLQETMEALRRTQAETIKQERLNALGKMVGGVAHDFNNVLMPILGLPQLLLSQPERMADRDEVQAVLQSVVSAATEARQIVRRLREFYRPNEPVAARAVSARDLIERVVALTEPAWRVQAQADAKHIDMLTDLADAPTIWGDESSLREALTNLVVNAIDAIREDGSIQISAMADGDWGLIRVTDTGIGMTDDVRRRLFEPFFTTKGDQGSGLGLSTSYGIVKRHGGRLEVRSEPGRGSTFTIRLPRVPPPATEPAPVDDQIQPPANLGLNVLVVDDHEASRHLLSACLQRIGCTVDATDSGDQAVQRLFTGSYDVLLTDRAMPGMNGDELARQAKLLAPEVLVIMLSGFGDLMRFRGECPTGVDRVLGKPVTQRELVETLRHVQPRGQRSSS